MGSVPGFRGNVAPAVVHGPSSLKVGESTHRYLKHIRRTSCCCCIVKLASRGSPLTACRSSTMDRSCVSGPATPRGLLVTWSWQRATRLPRLKLRKNCRRSADRLHIPDLRYHEPRKFSHWRRRYLVTRVSPRIPKPCRTSADQERDGMPPRQGILQAPCYDLEALHPFLGMSL